MTPPERETAPTGQSRLIDHFLERQVHDHGSGWAALWDADGSDLWDRGRPSIALIDVIEQRPDLFQPFTPDGRRKKALVPGCGRGYDVAMLALHGFDAYGLEISATGVAAAQAYASKELQTPQEYNFGSNEKNRGETRGTVSFIEGDFFSSDWQTTVSEAEEAKYDIIYDYTFLCALHPDMRQPWAARMRDLLSRDGFLVCLEFPMYKQASLLGPPWGLNGVHWDLLARGGDGVHNIDEPPETADTDRLGGCFKRVLYVKPPRSYENGRGTDMLSLYAIK